MTKGFSYNLDDNICSCYFVISRVVKPYISASQHQLIHIKRKDWKTCIERKECHCGEYSLLKLWGKKGGWKQVKRKFKKKNIFEPKKSATLFHLIELNCSKASKFWWNQKNPTQHKRRSEDRCNSFDSCNGAHFENLTKKNKTNRLTLVTLAVETVIF